MVVPGARSAPAGVSDKFHYVNYYISQEELKQKGQRRAAEKALGHASMRTKQRLPCFVRGMPSFSLVSRDAVRPPARLATDRHGPLP